jgi:hypothetical protein
LFWGDKSELEEEARGKREREREREGKSWRGEIFLNLY